METVMPTWQFWLQLAVALAAVLAAFSAAYAAWRGPVDAAMSVDRKQREYALRNQKMVILANLLQYRSNYGHDNFAGALNLIDLAFVDSPDVRNKWSEFHIAVNDPTLTNESGHKMRKDALMSLISEIAKDLGLGGKMGASDFNRIYYSDSDISRMKSV